MAVTDDEDGLVRAIVADPDDDTPLLVYADWLDEQGAADHAELIHETVRPANPRKTARRTKLETQLSERIAANLPRTPPRIQVHRGLAILTFALRQMVLKAFGRDVPAVLQRYHVHEVRIIGSTRDWSRLASVPALAGIRCLRLYANTMRDDGAAAMGKSPHLGRLCSLTLDNNKIGPEGMTQLFRGGLPGLCHVGLSWNRPGVEGLHALVDRPGAENLRRLDLSCTFIGPEGTAALASAPGLRGLTTLDLRSCDIGDRGLQSLASSPHLTGLANLTLNGNGITEDGARALIHSPLLPRLRWLDLTYNAIGPDAAEALAEAMRPHAHARLMLARYNHMSRGLQRAINKLLPGRITWR